MLLSLTQTAQLLGKTRRQVEYLIRQGRLTASKVGGRWQVDEAALALSPGQRQAARRRADALRGAADAALDASAPRPGYSMADLHAFRTVQGLWVDCGAALGAGDPAVAQLRTALDRLAVGCHRFERTDKASAYHAARDALALAACALHLAPAAGQDGLARRIENQAIPAVSGLLRRTQTRRGPRAGDSETR